LTVFLLLSCSDRGNLERSGSTTQALSGTTSAGTNVSGGGRPHRQFQYGGSARVARARGETEGYTFL
jgi:hypothetical protein